jgi:hypothetical protein
VSKENAKYYVGIIRNFDFYKVTEISQEDLLLLRVDPEKIKRYGPLKCEISSLLSLNLQISPNLRSFLQDLGLIENAIFTYGVRPDALPRDLVKKLIEEEERKRLEIWRKIPFKRWF